MMYTVATHLVEHLTGTTFSDFLEKNLFQPLGMSSTALQPWRARAKRPENGMAVGYIRDRSTLKYQGIPYVDGSECQGAGQIVTTSNDYAKWIKAMINQEGPITKDIYTALTTKRIQQDRSANGDQEHSLFYCLGWQIQTYLGCSIISHDGGEPGSQCDTFFIPKLKFGGVIFGNADHAGNTISLLKYQLIDQMMCERQNGKLPHTVISLTSGFGSGLVLESGSDDGYDHAMEIENDLLDELCPGIKESQPQQISLSAYVGQYWDPGYRGIKIEIVDGALFADCMDRSMGFTLTFRHICEQTKYLAYMHESCESTDIPIKAEFILENNRARKVGLQLEERLEGYTWFERQEQ
ncbi:hypothetical protein FQN49_006261 [Arthroderma sp. PD_2]|nr:hypothetical protein FQN49_006261 [Arthroderma sp. PD_2]